MPRLSSTILPSAGQKKRNGKIILYITYVISAIVGHIDGKHSCILPSSQVSLEIFVSQIGDLHIKNAFL